MKEKAVTEMHDTAHMLAKKLGMYDVVEVSMFDDMHTLCIRDKKRNHFFLRSAKPSNYPMLHFNGYISRDNNDWLEEDILENAAKNGELYFYKNNQKIVFLKKNQTIYERLVELDLHTKPPKRKRKRKMQA